MRILAGLVGFRVGPDSAEIMQGIGIALKAGATKSTFDGTVGIHPSSAEVKWSTRLLCIVLK